MERAKTLRIATWLHCLDMAADTNEITSQTMEVTQHGRGPLLELLLGPIMSSLTFAEVVEHILAKNQHRAECSLNDLWVHHAGICEELDNLIEVRRMGTIKSS